MKEVKIDKIIMKKYTLVLAMILHMILKAETMKVKNQQRIKLHTE